MGEGQSDAVLHAPQLFAVSSQNAQVSLPPPQVPSLHCSSVVQKSPSSHGATFGTCSQPDAPHRSSVQGLPSLQAVGSQVEPSGSGTSASGASNVAASRSMMGLR